jgi:hypothetical protein
MKLINHNKNNSYDIDTYVMHGTIEMTQVEFAQTHRFLELMYQKAKKNCDTAIRDGLNTGLRLMTRSLHRNPIDIGTTATALIAKAQGLKNYKQQNYGIKII